MKKRISVIIPIYNCEKYLDRCLESLIHQTYKNLEIILINDGSTDKTSIICDKYASKDTRIRYVNIQNSGVSNARNIGIEHSTGEYISFIDADDFLELNTYEECIDIINKENLDILKFLYIREYGKFKKETKFKCVTNKKINYKKYNTEIYLNAFSCDDFISVSNAIIKKELVKDIRFDTKLQRAEDFLFMMKAIDKSANIYLLDKIFYHYIANNSSATQRYGGYIRIISLLNDIFISNNTVLKNIKNNSIILKKYEIKVKSAINEKLGLIACNESYKIFKETIEKLKKLESFKEFCKNINTDNKYIDKSYCKYLKLKIKLGLKKYIKKLLIRGE